MRVALWLAIIFASVTAVFVAISAVLRTQAALPSRLEPPAEEPLVPSGASEVSADGSPPGSRVFVLAINGGGTPQTNFKSHLLHLRGIVALLSDAGVPRDRIIVLSGDGSDPALDVAARKVDYGPFDWRFQGTTLEDQLGAGMVLENSQVQGAQLFPATRSALNIWSLTVGQQLEPGDTVFLYVTDHGSRGEGPDRNRITLWGRDESISVRGVRRMLETLRAGVRVVVVMSQCFSGGFGQLYDWQSPGDRLPSGSFCGFFSSTADRPAYGCYPETRDNPEVGHSFVFLRSLRATGGRFDAAHVLTAKHDDTPDVPVRTSDIYLRDLLEREARRASLDVEPFVDRLLREAWNRGSRFDEERAAISRLGESFGVPVALTRAEVQQQSAVLASTARELRRADASLGRAQDRGNRTVLEQFLRAQPEWRADLGAEVFSRVELENRRQFGQRLGAALEAFASARGLENPGTAWRNREHLHSIAYRAEIRIGVYRRIGVLLDFVAGQVLLETLPATEREAYLSLRQCEGFWLNVPDAPALAYPVRALPTRAADDQRAATILAQASDPESRPKPLAIGKQVRTLDLTPYRGEIPVPGAGRPTLLFFWATWCAACKSVVPQLLQTVRSRGLAVVAVTDEPRETVDAFFANREMEFPLVVARDPGRRLIDHFGVAALPTFVLLSGEGFVVNAPTTRLKSFLLSLEGLR